MIAPSPVDRAEARRRSAARAPRYARRPDVAALLIECGLVERPTSPIQSRDDVPWGARFANAARQLGPETVVFGHYLSRRPDLLPLEDVLALAELLPADVGPRVPTSGEVLSRLADQMHESPEICFAEIDPKPCRVGFLRLDYLARMRKESDGPGEGLGREVVVRLQRPGLEALVEEPDSVAADLALLAPAFDLLGPGAADLTLWIDEYLAWAAGRLDLRSEAEGLRRCADDLVDVEALAVPEFALELCSAGLSVRQDLDGHELSAGTETQLGEVLRRLNLACLEQVLVAGQAPLDAAWSELSDGRLGLMAGRIERLPAACLPRLWSYLQHVAAYRPEDAWTAVRGEFRPVRHNAAERKLRLAFRQVVPFRDGGWTERRDSLAELLVLHWRLVHEHGFKASPALRALYLLVFQLADLGRRRGLDGDPLRAAIEDLRWLANWRRLRSMTDSRSLGDAMEQNLAGLLEMPQKLDRLLDLANGEAEGLRLQVASDDFGNEGRKTRITVAACLGLLMAALVLVAGELPQPAPQISGLLGTYLGTVSAWIEAAAAVLLLGLGLQLLRSILR